MNKPINYELLKIAIVEGVRERYGISDYNLPVDGHIYISEPLNDDNWEYVCTCEEYQSHKAEYDKVEDKQHYLDNLGINKMKEHKFKVGDLVDCRPYKKCLILAIEGESAWLKHTDGVLSTARLSDLKPHAPKQNWFGIEIDAFDINEPKDNKYYWAFLLDNESGCWGYVWGYHKSDNNRFETGIYTDEEKARRNFKLMREHMVKEVKKGR